MKSMKKSHVGDVVCTLSIFITHHLFEKSLCLFLHYLHALHGNKHVINEKKNTYD